jgi:hypothetical protein
VSQARIKDQTENLHHMRSVAGAGLHCKGDKMLKSFRVIGVSTVLLLVGWSVPAGAWQEKQEEKDKPAKSEQQAKPERQKQADAPQQRDQAKPEKQQQVQTPRQQQQAKPEKQQQTRAPQQQEQTKPEKQQQAKAPQDQKSQQQQDRPSKQEQRQVTGQQQHQPQVASSQRPERTQQAMAEQRAQPSLRLSARGNGRIPDERFQSNFGREHEFRMGNPVFVSGYSRFQYGGFWFGFVEPWPVGWYYTDDVYIDFVDGGYYMFDPYYPGARFAISVVL